MMHPVRRRRRVGARCPRARSVPGALLGLWLLACAGCAGLDTSLPGDLAPLEGELPAVHVTLDLPGGTDPDGLLADMRRVLVDETVGILWTRPPADAPGPRATWVLVRHESREDYGWLVPSVLTAGVLNLLGMPAASHEVRLTFALRLQDEDGAHLGEWTGSAVAHEYWAAWWGRPRDEAGRQARLDALHGVLADVRSRLVDPEGGWPLDG